jgi:hypothetical protein
MRGLFNFYELYAIVTNSEYSYSKDDKRSSAGKVIYIKICSD